jgi:hypothetical protein
VTSRDVCVSLQNLSPSGKVPAGLAKSMQCVVKIQMKKSFGAMAGGVETENCFASHAALGERRWFGDIMQSRVEIENYFASHAALGERLWFGDIMQKQIPASSFSPTSMKSSVSATSVPRPPAKSFTSISLLYGALSTSVGDSSRDGLILSAVTAQESSAGMKRRCFHSASHQFQHSLTPSIIALVPLKIVISTHSEDSLECFDGVLDLL